ncbi:tRNA (cytosine(72)-C(5))-methyltransferase NSUN6 isoform X2 [Brienomyrus brachyistius]|uniref:tRNA (cytosine(72)-C(5))-methyltransferase NSUN6 isoform X2 n=1 Tax=Brienomyrus brachyistius TaxID=42636 RepID=UPI0020B422E2|nr:tRNA (cytosine(72)-C(5))-methyltransferase NSUN6 isoform X2 [Brienomyrus brachyistius]
MRTGRMQAFGESCTRTVSVLPKLKLKPEVRQYLSNAFQNKELLTEVDEQEAEKKFEELLTYLSHPPGFTCVRASTHLESLETIREQLVEELQKVAWSSGVGPVPIFTHPQVPDVLLIRVTGPLSVCRQRSEVIVGAQCGNSVLRGAHVFAPGVLSAPKYMKAGDSVAVCSDVEGRCTRGATDFQGRKVFLGNGIAVMSRAEIFQADEPVRGVAVRVQEPVYHSPCFDGLLPRLVFLQNLPSVVVSHVLGPQPGERILDMCAAPGGKTSHIAALMGGQGEVMALDKIASKVERIRQNASTLELDCIAAYCFNSIRAVCADQAQVPGNGGPPFPPESFDRVLLDAPCSGLGQRPNMASSLSLREVTSYQPLQRKLFHAAVQLLRRGGTLVYSTCTITLAENEEQVAWALSTFPKLTLQPQTPHIGGEGMLGAGLSRDQRRLVQRFSPRHDPSDSDLVERDPNSILQQANADTIGFFIAKFQKT